jgi:hypothetical protein
MTRRQRRERLNEWIKTLNNEQKDHIILELTDFAIDAEYVNFYDNTKVPYYDGDGDNIDGTEREYED